MRKGPRWAHMLVTCYVVRFTRRVGAYGRLSVFRLVTSCTQSRERPWQVYSARGRRQAQQHPPPSGGLPADRRMHDAVYRIVLVLATMHHQLVTVSIGSRMSDWSTSAGRASSASGALINSEPLMTTPSTLGRQRHCPSGMSHSCKLVGAGAVGRRGWVS